MREHVDDPRWVAAANWAAAGGHGVGAIAQREGVTRIEALLAVADEWQRAPHLFTAPAAEVAPWGRAQCPDCGIWFADVQSHRIVHRPDPGAPARAPRSRRGRPRPVESARPGPPGRAATVRRVPLTDLPADAPWRTWADAANWAAAKGYGPSRLADRVGTDAASVTVAIIDAWSRDPGAFTVPASMGTPASAVKQCPACGLWFASVDNHVAAHGRIGGRRRGAVRAALRAGEHDGHAAPRTEFERAMELGGLLDPYLELRRSVLEHLNTAQFRTRIDVADEAFPAILRSIVSTPGYDEALGELRRSGPGVLFDDDDRVQCHLCGLWQAMITPHLPVHGVAAAAYRARFGLDRDDPLVSRSVITGRLR